MLNIGRVRNLMFPYPHALNLAYGIVVGRVWR